MSVHLLHGDDESTLRGAVSGRVRELVGEHDRSLMVDEFDGEEYTLGDVVDAANTPPMFGERRVVVARMVSRFNVDELAVLTAAVPDLLDTTDLVVVWGSGRVVKALADAVNRAGGTTASTSLPTRSGDRKAWISGQAAVAGVKLNSGALETIAEQLGDDLGRLDGILHTLAGTFGSKALTPADVAPFIGDAGDLPPWSLTDAIMAGNTAKALSVLGRMTGAGARHPLQVMATLHAHYQRLARLDGVDARNEDDVAQALGIKPGFPARKALEHYRSMGSAAIRRAFEILASADVDLRGRRDLPDDVTMDIAVARLSRLRR